MEYRFYCNIEEIKKAHEEAGGYFFKNGNRGFKSHIYPLIFQGCLFITSDRTGIQDVYGQAVRAFTVRRCTADGDITNASPFGAYHTLKAAQRTAKSMPILEERGE